MNKKIASAAFQFAGRETSLIILLLGGYSKI